METARTRIGRITLKSGGSVRLVERVAGNACTERLRKWTSDVVAAKPLVAAICCAAFSYVEDGWQCHATWDSVDGAIPLRILPTLAERSIQSMMTTGAAEARVMENLGYRLPDPDPAA